MKKTDVRIGNLVYAFKGVWDIDSTDFSGEQISTYEPIPLTEKWLVKCGFEHCRAGLFGNNYTLNGVSIQLKGFGVYVFVPHARCEILYVHQLQNLYFALTGEELIIRT